MGECQDFWGNCMLRQCIHIHYPYLLTSTHTASGGPAAAMGGERKRGHLALRQGTSSPAPLLYEWISVSCLDYYDIPFINIYKPIYSYQPRARPSQPGAAAPANTCV